MRVSGFFISLILLHRCCTGRVLPYQNQRMSGTVSTMQDKMVFPDGDQTVPLHLSEFFG